QLRAQGEDVALTAMFDTVNWSKLSPSTFWDKFFYQAERLLFHGRNFLILDLKGKFSFFREKITVLRSRLSVWRGIVLDKFTTTQGSESESRLLARIWETNDQAAMKYVPQPYPGVITDFRPVQQYSRYGRPDIHWDPIALNGQQVVTLPVYPAGML